MVNIGQLSPIKVRAKKGAEKKYEIVYGHRRVQAARELGWRTIRSEIVNVSDNDMIVLALAENISRSDFTDFEKALLLKKLHEEQGWRLGKIAESLGKSVSYVSQHISMLSLFGEQLIPDSESFKILTRLSEGHARIIARLPLIRDRIEVARFVVIGGLGVRETQRLVSQNLSGAKKKLRKTTTKKKVTELHLMVAKLISAYEREAFSEVVEVRHKTKFSLFDDIPPFERLNYNTSLLHTTQISRTMKNVKILVDGVEVNVFRDFGVVSFYLRYYAMWKGQAFRQCSRASLVFLRTMGSWKIVHEHWSPLYQDSKNSFREESADADDRSGRDLALSPKYYNADLR